MILRPKFGLWAVKIVIETEDEKGRIKKVTEEHLYDAVNPTDAEKQATAEMDGTIYEWSIKSITKTKFCVVGSPDDKEK